MRINKITTQNRRMVAFNGETTETPVKTKPSFDVYKKNEQNISFQGLGSVATRIFSLGSFDNVVTKIIEPGKKVKDFYSGGKVVKSKLIISNKLDNVTHYTYNSRGKIDTSTEMFANGSKIFHIYDLNGNLMKAVKTTKKGAEIETFYLHHFNGNVAGIKITGKGPLAELIKEDDLAKNLFIKDNQKYDVDNKFCNFEIEEIYSNDCKPIRKEMRIKVTTKNEAVKIESEPKTQKEHGKTFDYEDYSFAVQDKVDVFHEKTEFYSDGTIKSVLSDTNGRLHFEKYPHGED